MVVFGIEVLVDYLDVYYDFIEDTLNLIFIRHTAVSWQFVAKLRRSHIAAMKGDANRA